MKKLNTKGFSIVEGILIVVIIGLIAGVGYYVWNQNDVKDIKSNITDSSQNQVEEPAEEEWVGRPLAFDPKGEITEGQKETIHKMTFTQPTGWQRKYFEDDENFHKSVTYSSPDFKGVQFVNGSSVTEGGDFYVEAYFTEYKSIEQMEKAGVLEGGYFSKESYAEIDGVKAAKGTCGHFGRAECYALVYKDEYYQLSYRQIDEGVKNSKTPENKYKNEFKSLLDSVNFE